MKTLYLIGGPMGVGKTTVGQLLKRRLDRSVFLDGDWCWDAHPFQVTDETREMVLQNICTLLNNFLRCSAYEHVIFCWVMQEQAIMDSILARLTLGDFRTVAVSLVCPERELQARLRADVDRGLRSGGVIGRSLSYLPRFQTLNTIQIDTAGKTPAAVADEIARL